MRVPCLIMGNCLQGNPDPFVNTIITYICDYCLLVFESRIFVIFVRLVRTPGYSCIENKYKDHVHTWSVYFSGILKAFRLHLQHIQPKLSEHTNRMSLKRDYHSYFRDQTEM